MRSYYSGMFISASWILLGLVGCGQPNDLGVKVSGSVMIGGEAKEGARVTFIPEDKSPEARPGGAATKSDGTFETLVKPGKYKVIVSRMVDKSGNVPSDSDDPSMDYTQLLESGYLKETISPKYTSPDSTPLSVEIPAGGKALEPLNVES